MPPRDHDRDGGPPEPSEEPGRTDFADRVRDARAGRRGLIANIPGMVYQARVEDAWPMEFVSAGARELTGYAPEDFLAGGPRAFGDLIHAEDRTRVWEEVAEAVEADSSFSVEYRIHHADGEVRHVWDHGHPVFDADGGVLCVEGIILDVTERALLAEQLRHAQRRETVGRLSGVVAHDFNNYLTGIIGSLELALPDLAPDAPARESVMLALEAGRKARDLTRQLLLVSRSRPQKREVVDLSERVQALSGFLSQVVGSPVELKLEADDGRLPVLVDPILVDQILLNLVVNAREALGGYGRIVVRARREGPETVTLEVEDDGQGMDEATRRRAFEPFFTTKDTGTGLGLATVRAIVQELGGDIDLRSSAGAGCTCSITLPLARAGEEPTKVAERDGGTNRHGQGQRVLVVDDDSTVLRLVSTVLRRFGYEPEAAADPETCLRLAEGMAEPPALALLDITLPGCSGIELAQRLRERGLVTRTLFMSGYAPEQMVTGPDSLRDTPYLEKPFSVDELLSAVARSLEPDADRGDVRSDAV